MIDNIFCLSSLARYYPCFIAGVMMREYNVESLNRYAGLIFLCISIVGFSNISGSKNLTFLLCVGAYIFSAVLLFYFIKYIESSIPSILHKMLTHLGKYSLSIYIIHFFFVPKVPSFLPDAFVFNFTYSLITAIIVSYLSLLTGRFLSLTTPLNKVLR